MTFAQTEIVASGLEAAAMEMCASLIRTACSPNIKERADCSTSLCDMDGRTLALATHGPAHLGSTLGLVPAILKRFPLETLRPGDIFFANDPYIVGVTHLNDCTAAAPIFFDNRPIAFAAAVAHHSDVGGRVPGSESGDSTSIFQEGVRIPPMRLYEAAKRRDDVWELFLLNSRTPHFSEGDLYAQTGALRRGIERVQELYARHGAAAMATRIPAMLDATERRVRAAIDERLRPGTYRAEDWLDDDGITGNPVRLAVGLTVGEGRLHFDFSDAAAQLPSGKNVPLTHTMATIYYCVKTMVDPAFSINEGLYRPIDVTAPEESVVNPRSPSGVSSRNLTSMILADVLMNVLGQAAPDRAMAAGGPYQGITMGGPDPVRGRYFVDYETFAGGQGALCSADGMDVTQIHMSNTSNLPIEVMEIEFPLRVEEYEMVADSGGAGTFRGGLGVRRDLRIMVDGAVLSLRSARQAYPAQGLAGGGSGRTSVYLLNPGTESEERLPFTLSEHPLRNGDLLRIISPGGGGFGDPLARDADRVCADVVAGKVTAKQAGEAYGVVLTQDGRAVDAAATARLRRRSETAS